MVCYDQTVETYHAASLNGVPFTATSMTDQFGRRGPNHLYPDRDVPYAEDLGRKQQQFTVNGKVFGEDHAAQARRLKDAAERVSPATLVHPIWGTQLVKVETLSVENDIENAIGETTFSIQAVEFGGLGFPTAVAALGALPARFSVASHRRSMIFLLPGSRSTNVL